MLPPCSLLYSLSVRKKEAIQSNPQLKNDINRKPSFKVVFFKTSCHKVAFVKIFHY